MNTHPTRDLDTLDGLRRIETFDRDAMFGLCMELTHAVYPHDEVYERYCTIEEYIDCPPQDVYRYLANPYSLEEWTWSTRGLQPCEDPELVAGYDRLADNTRIYCRTRANDDAMTVDYHCAWDQPDQLWMIYLMRVVPASLVLGRSGSVVTWTNCHHPNYDENPYPEAAPDGREEWVGDLWPFFYAGHKVEMANLKRILEHRHAQGLPIGPHAGPQPAGSREIKP